MTIKNEYAETLKEQIEYDKKRIADIIKKWERKVPSCVALFNEGKELALEKIEEQRKELEKNHEMKTKVTEHKLEKRRKKSLVGIVVCFTILAAGGIMMIAVEESNRLYEIGGRLAAMAFLGCMFFGGLHRTARAYNSLPKPPKQLSKLKDLVDDIGRVDNLKHKIKRAEKELAGL